MTTYLSQIVGKPVWDAKGDRVGRCVDVLVAEVDTGFPTMRALAVANGAKSREHAEGSENYTAPQLIGAEHIAWLSPSIILNSCSPPAYQTRGDELWLARQVLDRQIVDTEGRRLVRVNDLQLARVTTNGGHYRLAGADVGSLGMLRRLGIERLALGFLRLLRRPQAATVIPWNEVAPLQADEPIRLRISRDKIGELHPADIADIIEELDRPMGQALLQTFDNETIADTMQEIEPELQASMLGTLPPERAADVLEEMDPDEAADVLGDLQPQQRAELLDLMDDEDATDIEKLLKYPEDTAGGIMTTDFVTIPVGLNVGQALNYLRQSRDALEDEALYYVYVVDRANTLQGVITLRDLVLAPPKKLVQEIMDPDAISVDSLRPQTEVAKLVAKYNLLAVPVVDSQNVIHGIVTADDAIDAIIPTKWKKRLPHFF
jgi:magnesium transporter